MAHLEWSDALSLDLPLMDDTHREFVALLAIVQSAADAQLPAAWQHLIDHTDAHFGQEDRWMAATRFASANCHSLQHKVVLQVMREGAAQAADGKLGAVRTLASELALWFPQHAQSLDAALALHLRRAGYDPLTGVVSRPEDLPAGLVQGCGSADCSDAVSA
ncbi:hemerythrin domain-containing protein [Polaromonas sp. SM01]|uniref:hemerythrin domain-containing protein n=1 Tax=Polaromonas sp. SM01 TaxID=3085630 RepID=UPI0029811AE3|nr:hemerythrin domain-containing protein [Polaromonas sp. SM01]MDW5441024.1 hemerythrin domain-containing protein [Polaromonas sp. SM01]